MTGHGHPRTHWDDTDVRQAFGRRLNQLAKARGWRPREAAERCGVSEAAWYRWQNGTRQPPLEYLPVIAAAFGVSVAELVEPLEDFE